VELLLRRDRVEGTHASVPSPTSPKDLCMDRLILDSKRERASLEEGTDEVGAATEAAHSHSDGLAEDSQVGWAQSTEGMLLQPGPEPFVGVELGSVGGETIHAKTAAVDGQGGTGQPGAVRVAAVPEQKQGRGNPAQQVTNKADHLEAGDGAGNQVEIGMGVGRDGGDGGQLGPVEAVTQDGRLSARRPGAAGRRQQREATLVHKNQRTLQPPGVFFIRGQVCSTQCRMAFSSRSRARPVGFCQLQPKPWSKRHT
jgi:hypothetical protein